MYDRIMEDFLDFSLQNRTEFKHYGVGHNGNPPGRGSGAHPYGSGERPFQHDPKARAQYLKAKNASSGGTHIGSLMMTHKLSEAGKNAASNAYKRQQEKAKTKDKSLTLSAYSRYQNELQKEKASRNISYGKLLDEHESKAHDVFKGSKPNEHTKEQIEWALKAVALEDLILDEKIDKHIGHLEDTVKRLQKKQYGDEIGLKGYNFMYEEAKTKLKSPLEMRDRLMGLGHIEEENTKENRCLTLVNVKNNMVPVETTFDNGSVHIVSAAKEGLIKQNLSGAALKKVKQAMMKSHGKVR